MLKIITCFLVLTFEYGYCKSNLWSQGKIYFSISPKDYDLHSQDVIMSTMFALEKEICLKFFQILRQYNETEHDRILFIHNPMKLKDCPTQQYDYSSKVLEMVIGYKCLGDKSNVARAVVEMLKAGIPEDAKLEGNDDETKIFGQASPGVPNFLIPASERYFINTQYQNECLMFHQPSINSRRDNNIENESKIDRSFYGKYLWPFGLVMYTVDPDLSSYQMIRHAMNEIQRSSCIAFQEVRELDGVLSPKSYLSFGKDGYVDPPLGYQHGIIDIHLENFTNSDPGHAAHVINNFMRILGVFMMSNRYDRDRFIKINWDRIPQDKRQFLDLAPREAFIDTSYCFASVTHAPINFKCPTCDLGQQSVSPVSELLWHRSMRMGKVPALTMEDKEILRLMYGPECSKRNE